MGEQTLNTVVNTRYLVAGRESMRARDPRRSLLVLLAILVIVTFQGSPLEPRGSCSMVGWRPSMSQSYPARWLDSRRPADTDAKAASWSSVVGGSAKIILRLESFQS
jgi:hypothetical protein